MERILDVTIIWKKQAKTLSSKIRKKFEISIRNDLFGGILDSNGLSTYPITWRRYEKGSE